MEIAAIAAAILGFLGIVINSISSQEAARKSDSRQLENQKELMRYENELQQSTNTIATQKGHAAAAGYSPALLYGQGFQQAEVSGGTGQGTMPDLSALGKIGNTTALNNVYEAIVTKRSQDMQRERLQSDIALNRQKILESAANTAEKTRYTGLQRQLEKTIIDQATANLHLTESQTENNKFLTRRGNLLLPGELAAQGLLNEQTARQTEKIVSDTTKNNFEMAEIRANIRRINKLNEVSDEEKRSIVESVKSSAVGRIMSQYGLNKLKMPASWRKDKVWQYQHADQIKGAFVALRSMGFDEQEAKDAVIYYVSDGKNSSGVAGAIGAILGALVKKS